MARWESSSDCRTELERSRPRGIRIVEFESSNLTQRDIAIPLRGLSKFYRGFLYFSALSACLLQRSRLYKRPDWTVSPVSSWKTTMLLGNWLYYLFLFDLLASCAKLCKAMLIRCLMPSITDENREDGAVAKILSNSVEMCVCVSSVLYCRHSISFIIIKS